MFLLSLDHLQRLVVILYSYVSAINICMKFLKAKTDGHPLSMLAYLVSTSVSILLAKAMGLFWRRQY